MIVPKNFESLSDSLMFGLGFGEVTVILILALIFLGPKRLPEVGKKVGEFYRQFRETADTVKGTITGEFEEEPEEEPTEKESDSHHGAD